MACSHRLDIALLPAGGVLDDGYDERRATPSTPSAGGVHDDDVRAAGATQPTLASEVRAQLFLTLPLALTLLTRFLQGFIDLAVVGRLLGARELAGASLALTLQFTSMGLVTGGAGDAVASLCSQALGAGQPELCGLWLQVGLLSSTAAMLALLPLWWCAGALVSAAGAGECGCAGCMGGASQRWCGWRTRRGAVLFFSPTECLALSQGLLPSSTHLRGSAAEAPSSSCVAGGSAAEAPFSHTCTHTPGLPPRALLHHSPVQML